METRLPSALLLSNILGIYLLLATQQESLASPPFLLVVDSQPTPPASPASFPSCFVCLVSLRVSVSARVFFSQAKSLEARATTRGDAKDAKHAKEKLKRCVGRSLYLLVVVLLFVGCGQVGRWVALPLRCRPPIRGSNIFLR